MKQAKLTVEGTAYRAGRSENRRQRKINAAITEQAEAWRNTDWRTPKSDDLVPDMVLTLTCDADQSRLQFTSHTMARAFIRNRQANIHGDFNTLPDVIVESEQSE